MRRNRHRFLSLGISIFAVLTLSPALVGQAAPDSEAAFGLPTDWSHHHVIFSKPGSAEQASRVQQDPRYWQQLSRRSSVLTVAEKEASASALQPELRPANNGHLNGDWSQDIGSGASVGATDYPAKYSFNLSRANCGGAAQPDFAVYTTGIFGSSQASIVAYDNLYSGCGGTVPSVYWAYSTGADTLTSPVFSRDGTQIAFVQSNSLGRGVLVLLKWAASTTESVTSPATPLHVSPAAYPTCTAPCLTTFGLPGLPATFNNDTNSSVFYDYSADTAYVGDDAGFLHKFTSVFNGVPTQVTTGGWPVQVNPGAPTALTSPVHDYASGNVFVADAGGFLYLVNSTTAVVTISGQLDFSSAEAGAGIVQGPIVDSTAGLVYVFASSDGSGSCIGGTDCTAVYQLSTSFTSGAIGSEAVVGASTLTGTAPSPLYLGAFDSTYENSLNATGNLYVCGNTGGPPVLYQVAIAAGAFGAVNPGPVLSGSTTPCSPVTDVMNPNVTGGATEWMFASVQTGGVSSGCSSGGCLFNFKDKPWKPSTVYAVGQEVLDTHFQIQVVTVGGTSGPAAPGWSTIVGRSTTDGGVHWLNQGVQSAFTLAAWAPSHVYALHSKILDPSNNVEFVTTAGTSGSTIPTFSATAGGVTSDGATLKWTNLGALGTAAMPAAGGTSGIVIDNTVSSGTEPGASQIYFSTLNGGCGTGGTDGCAVQASQSALQ